MDNIDVLSCTIQTHENEAIEVTDGNSLPEKVSIMRGEASAEIVDDITSNNSTPWPMNHEVKQEKDTW